MASISTPDLEGILEQKGILGAVQRLNLNYSLDTWVYHDRKAHKVFVDAGIRLFSPVCGCVGMVHMTNLGPGSGLLLSRIDPGLPGIMPPKTGIFAHQMEPVDTPAHFENEVKELIEHFPMILDKWTASKAHYERERKKEESERKRPPVDELPSMPAPAEPPTVTCPRVDSEPVAAPEKKEPPTIVCPREQPTNTCPRVDTEPVAASEKEEPPTIVCPREQPTQDGPVTVETEPKMDELDKAQQSSEPTKRDPAKQNPDAREPEPWPNMPEILEKRIGATYTDGLPRFNILWDVRNDYTRSRLTVGHAYLIIAVNLSPSEMLRMTNYLDHELAGKVEGKLTVVGAGDMDINGVLHGAPIVTPWHRTLHGMLSESDHMAIKTCGFGFEKVINGKGRGMFQPCAGMILWQLQKDHGLEDCSNAKSIDEAIDRTAANLVKKSPGANFFTTWNSTELKDPKS